MEEHLDVISVCRGISFCGRTVDEVGRKYQYILQNIGALGSLIEDAWVVSAADQECRITS